jgi:uncharacterized protein YndB with AHSA1/START domain
MEFTMANRSVQFHRVFKCPPERVYKAFTDAEGMSKWLPPYGFTCKVHSFDARVGGGFKMHFTNFGTGKIESFGGTFLELKANERLRYNDTFDDPNLPGTMIVTVQMKKVVCGTEVFITQEGIPEPIPLEFCYLGWQESLEQLAHLVDPEIPDAG